MADPTGTIGAKDINDMDLVLDGGSTFEGRLRELEQQRTLAARAFKELNLGKAAAAAFREAKEKAAEAEQAKAEAIKVLADARVKAEQVMADAQTEAARIAVGAQRVALAKLAEAEQTRKKAEDEMAAGSARAKAAEDEAHETLKIAQQTRDSLRLETKRHLDARDQAAMAKQTADQTTARFQDKINRLQEVLRELTGG